jgi:hypothetical protein
MIYLPEDLNVSVKKLSACFNNTSASYKFYWFLSILDAVSKQKKIKYQKKKSSVV